MVRRTRVDVGGMSCATCSATIAEALEALEGVEEASANFATDETTVAYDPDRVSLAAIYEAIEEAGYEPVAETRTLSVGGMSCATCVETVSEAVADVPGVVEADANFATDEATLTVNPGAFRIGAAYDAIEEAGYDPIRAGDGEQGEDGGDGAAGGPGGGPGQGERAVDRELRKQRRLVVLGGLLTAPFLLVMAEMVGLVALPETVAGLGVGWIEFALATVLMATLGKEFVVGAWRAWRTDRRANMDTLIALGAGTGYVYSTVVLLGLLSAESGLYFEAVAFILWFITVGNWLEARSKARAGDALRQLLELEAEEATVVERYGEEGGGQESTVPLEAVAVGDVLKVRPGERIPTDGVVVDGESAVDESAVTGESVPVAKVPGDEVVGSTINEEGVLFVEATKVGEDTAVRRIVERVREAQARQPDVQRTVDRIAGYFVPAVIANAVLWAALWLAFPAELAAFVEWLPLWTPVGGGPALGAGGGVPILEFGVIVLASAVLIACPCALGLATPAATMVGSTIAARNGVLFEGGDVLESSRDVDAVVFDKTGTLTLGELTLTDVVPASEFDGDGGIAADGGALASPGLDEEALLAAAASAERGSEHPLAEAIVAGARERGLDPGDPEAFEALAGKGVRATTEHGEVLVGTDRLLAESGVDNAPAAATMARLESEGKTAMLVAVDGELAGVLAAADEVRESARETVATLQARGLAVYMLTGDNERTARAVAAELGIPAEHVRAEVLPEEKADAIEGIQADGRRAMMVGDGINDAPALATAHVGVAIGSGTDVAIESGDVTLLRDDPADVLKALRIADATIAKVYQNLLWALGYNATLIPVASLGLLNPALAGLAMAASSVSVMANSLLFARYDPHRDYELLVVRLLKRPTLLLGPLARPGELRE